MFSKKLLLVVWAKVVWELFQTIFPFYENSFSSFHFARYLIHDKQIVCGLPVADQDTFFIELSKEFWGDVVGDVEGDRHLNPSPVHRVHFVFHPQDLPAGRGGMSWPISARHCWRWRWVGCGWLPCRQFWVDVDFGHPPGITPGLCSVLLRLPRNLPLHPQHIVSLFVTVASIFVPSFCFILCHNFLKSKIIPIVRCQTSQPSPNILN